MKKFLILVCAALVAIASCGDKENAFLKINKDKLKFSFGISGGSVSIPVNSNNPFIATPSEQWCKASIVGQSIKVIVDELEAGQITSRTAKITISSKGCSNVDVTINQDVILIENKPESFILTASQLGFSITIDSGIELKFEHPEWVTAQSGNWESGLKKYSFTAQQYDVTGGTREGFLTIKSNDANIGYELKIPIVQTNVKNEFVLKLMELWKNSPTSLTPARRSLMLEMEEYANAYVDTDFQNYLKASNSDATKIENDNAIMSCYRYSFDYVLNKVKNTVVPSGKTYIWTLFNMGIVVKTPSICFGIDINHRDAELLAPYLDFLCVTHNHADHVSKPLMQAMQGALKPILSNYYSGGGSYTSTISSSYTIKSARIKTSIVDHDTKLLAFTTAFRVELGEDAGNFSIMHCGDTNYLPAQYSNTGGGSVDMLVLRYGHVNENRIIGTGSGQVTPKNVIFSHLLELRHKIGVSPARATITSAFKNIKNINCNNTFVPFWGEKLIWDGKTLSSEKIQTNTY